ncbi:hypothetical protein LI095_10155, partial [Veillonella atypica]|uniref:hypothetical protein n=1 Tax=Veillonella atypica TaxID=39777 RepID=UPI001D0805EB
HFGKSQCRNIDIQLTVKYTASPYYAHRYQHGSHVQLPPLMQYSGIPQYLLQALHAYYIFQGKLRHAFSMLSASSKQSKDLCAGIQQNPGY